MLDALRGLSSPAPMRKHASIPHRIRCLFQRWLDVSPYTQQHFAAAGLGAHVDPGVFISDPACVRLGPRTAIYRGCTILCGPGTFEMGEDSHLAASVYVNALQASVTVGAGTAVGPFSVLLSYSNDVKAGVPIIHARRVSATHIGSDVFIGAGAVILPGVSIGSRAVVAAGAVVTHNVAEGDVVGGVPARPISRRV